MRLMRMCGLAGAVVLCVMSAGARAETGDCAEFAQIARKAVELRGTDAEMMDAMVAIAEGYEGDQARFAGAVPLIVDHIWSLPEETSADEAAEAWQTQCEAM